MKILKVDSTTPVDITAEVGMGRITVKQASGGPTSFYVTDPANFVGQLQVMAGGAYVYSSSGQFVGGEVVGTVIMASGDTVDISVTQELGGGASVAEILAPLVVQDQLDLENTDEAAELIATALLNTLYMVTFYAASKGDGSGEADFVVSWTDLAGTQRSNAADTLNISGSDSSSVAFGTFPILAKAGTPISVASSFSVSPFHYDFSVRLVQMPKPISV